MGHDCLICQELAVDAVKCSHCQKLFCRSHLMVWVRKSGNCPHCRQKLTVQAVCYMAQVALDEKEASLSAFLPKLLVSNNEKVQCPFAGCGANVKVEEMRAHLDVCPFGKYLAKEDEVPACDGGDQEEGGQGRGRSNPAPAQQQQSSAHNARYFVSAAAPIPMPQSDDPNVDFHFVRIEDTLSGIAVLYKTNPGHIMRMNNLFSENIYGRVWLRVPRCEESDVQAKRYQPTEEELETMRRRKALREFMRATSTDEYEAEVYLSHVNHDLREALKNYFEDVAWDVEHPKLLEDNRDLREFIEDVVYGMARGRCSWECTGCKRVSRTISETKTPCVACGALYCASCPSRLHPVPRAWLGATSPSAHVETATVCGDCLPQLRVDAHVYRKMSAVSV